METTSRLVVFHKYIVGCGKCRGRKRAVMMKKPKTQRSKKGVPEVQEVFLTVRGKKGQLA